MRLCGHKVQVALNRPFIFAKDKIIRYHYELNFGYLTTKIRHSDKKIPQLLSCGRIWMPEFYTFRATDNPSRIGKITFSTRESF